MVIRFYEIHEDAGWLHALEIQDGDGYLKLGKFNTLLTNAIYNEYPL